MKIIAISEEMFEQLCNKVTPMQRGAGGIMAARCFYLYAQQALIVVDGDCTLGTLEDMPVPTSLTQLGAAAKACETRPLAEAMSAKQSAPFSFESSLAKAGIEMAKEEALESIGVLNAILQDLVKLVNAVPESPEWRPLPPISSFAEKNMKPLLDELGKTLTVDTGGLVESAEPGLYERFTEKARRAVFFAQYEAQQHGDRQIECWHLLLGVVREGGDIIRQLRKGLHVTEIICGHIENDCHRRVPGFPEVTSDPMLSRDGKKVIIEASRLADNWGSASIGLEHILAALAGEEAYRTDQILSHVGITGEVVKGWAVKRDAASAPPPSSSDDASAGRDEDYPLLLAVDIKGQPKRIHIPCHIVILSGDRLWIEAAGYPPKLDALGRFRISDITHWMVCSRVEKGEKA